MYSTCNSATVKRLWLIIVIDSLATENGYNLKLSRVEPGVRFSGGPYETRITNFLKNENLRFWLRYWLTKRTLTTVHWIASPKNSRLDTTHGYFWWAGGKKQAFIVRSFTRSIDYNCKSGLKVGERYFINVTMRLYCCAEMHPGRTAQRRSGVFWVYRWNKLILIPYLPNVIFTVSYLQWITSKLRF